MTPTPEAIPYYNEAKEIVIAIGMVVGVPQRPEALHEIAKIVASALREIEVKAESRGFRAGMERAAEIVGRHVEEDDGNDPGEQLPECSDWAEEPAAGPNCLVACVLEIRAEAEGKK